MNGECYLQVNGECYLQVNGECYLQVNGECYLQVNGECYLQVNGECYLQVNGECYLQVNGECYLQVNGECYLQVNGECYLQVNGECYLQVNGECYLQVNGEPVLTVEYDRASRSELLRDAARSQLLRVVYTPSGLPTAFEPPAPVAGANASYDGAGRLRHWHRAGTHLEYRYDRHGNLTERRANGAATYRYTYEAGTRVSHLLTNFENSFVYCRTYVHLCPSDLSS